MIYNPSEESDWVKIMQVLESAKIKGKRVELKTLHPSRSLPQNRYLHLILGWFALATGYTMEEVKLDIFKRTCNMAIFRKTRTASSGSIVYTVKSTRELTTEEMTIAIERFRNYASTKAGIYLPSAEEREYLNQINNEIEKNKEFL